MLSTTMGHMRKARIGLWLLVALIAVGAGTASAARVKDIATLRGVQSSQVVGLGLVIGLNRTGDRTTSVPFTRQMVENMLRRTGLTFEENRGFLDTDNVAAVMVTADIAPFARQGTEFDVQVSSIGGARSLYGGLLLKTSLMLGGTEVGVAQGSVTTGGFQAGAIGSNFQRNSVTTANVPNGGVLVADIGGGALTTPDPNAADPATAAQTLTLGLHNPDFTTAARVADAVNASLGGTSAVAIDAATVRIDVPATSQAGIVQFISAIEALDVTPDQRARVVVDERTGTVVMSRDVRISEVAITHGNITVDVLTRATVSQPAPFSRGETRIVPESDLLVTEPGPDMYEGGPVQVLPASTSLNQLVQALNALGVSPRDLVVILQKIRAAGALQAELTAN